MEHIVYLKIENDIHSARVTPIVHPHHQLYHVVFEDGYENIFFTDVETGNWVEEDIGETVLAANFGASISHFEDHRAKPHKVVSWCRASIAEMTINFGFCMSQNKGQTVFDVYADNRKFLCSLVKDKKGKWEMYGYRRHATEYQYTNLVQIIISIFESMADAR